MDFFNILKNKYNIDLNEEQKNATSHINGPALILAGPGSGKTTVITARVAYLIKAAGIKPQNILTLTFNKAAQLEMEKRFNRLYGSDITERVHFSTLHSFCNRIVRDYERMKGRRLHRIEGNDQEINKHQLLKDIYQSINNSKINDDELETLINEIGLVKNSLIKDFDGLTLTTKRFQQIYKAYEEYKKSNLLIDFDDMLTYAYSILSKYTELLEHYRSNYSYIQVDEGQDLSKIQFEIIRLLSEKHRNLFIVADDDQSIYGFRGAHPRFILDFEKQFLGCSIFRLENNYRSTEDIVSLSSRFIKNNKNRYDKNHVTLNEKLTEPEIIKALDQRDQLQFILDKLTSYSQLSDLEQSTQIKPQTRIKGRKKQIAILYRNNLSSVLTADILNRNGIPFRLRQNRLFFFKHWLVQEVSAFLLFALDPMDVEAFSKIYYRMNRYISKAMLECAMTGNAGKPVIDRIMAGVELKPFQIEGLQQLKLEFSNLAKKPPFNALEYIKNNFKYLESVKEYCSLVGMSYEYISRLFEILQGIALNCQTIVEYLDRLSELYKLFEGSSNWDNNEGILEITLSTIHSSKGLEYDCVFMIDLINSELPGEKAIEKAAEAKDLSLLEEERRLYYVGMTRARQSLFMIYPTAANGGRLSPSLFLKELAVLLKKKLTDGFAEGVIVRHAKFGRGVVISQYSPDDLKPPGELIEIKFFNGIVRKLDLMICLENRLLEFEKTDQDIAHLI